MSKFEAVLRRIARLAPDEKCLVFSAFDEALTKLAVALRQNKVGCVRLVGGREVGPCASIASSNLTVGVVMKFCRLPKHTHSASRRLCHVIRPVDCVWMPHALR